jgi:hypothetical protein
MRATEFINEGVFGWLANKAAGQIKPTQDGVRKQFVNNFVQHFNAFRNAERLSGLGNGVDMQNYLKKYLEQQGWQHPEGVIDQILKAGGNDIVKIANGVYTIAVSQKRNQHGYVMQPQSPTQPQGTQPQASAQPQATQPQGTQPQAPKYQSLASKIASRKG